MRTWKRILTIMILLLVSTMTFFACKDKDPYADMKIVIVETTGLNDNNVFVLSSNQEDNSFDIVATVEGVGDDVSKKITATSSNNGLVSIKTISTEGEYTTISCVFNVAAGADIISNTATIVLDTEEGNKTYNFDVSIIIPLQAMSVNLEQIFIAKGQVVSLDEYPNLVSYVPSNTTEKGFSTYATPVTSGSWSESSITVINEYMANNRGKIFVDQDIDSFYLEIKSNSVSTLTGDYETRKVLVVVLDAMDTEAFGVIWNGGGEEGSLVLFDEDNKTLTLVINSDDHYNYHEADLQLTFNDQPLSSITNTYTTTNLEGETVDNTYRMYSVHVENLSSYGKVARLGQDGKLKMYKSSNLGIQDELFTDNDLIAATKTDSDDTVKISQRGRAGEYTLTFIIDYYTCQGLYQPFTIDVKVITAAMPSEIKLFAPKFDTDNATNEDAGYGDKDIVLYSNGNGTQVKVVVWGNGGVIENQAVEVAVDATNISITKDSMDIVVDGVAVATTSSGDVLTIKKLGELTGEVTLTLTSVYFPSISKVVTLSYINDNTSISFANTNLMLSAESFKTDPTTKNRDIAIFTSTETFIQVTGLPTIEGTEDIDYSTLTLMVVWRIVI